jgi:hypothetical protein
LNPDKNNRTVQHRWCGAFGIPKNRLAPLARGNEKIVPHCIPSLARGNEKSVVHCIPSLARGNEKIVPHCIPSLARGNEKSGLVVYAAMQYF